MLATVLFVSKECGLRWSASLPLFIGSGYGYGTVSGGLWAIDMEGGHVVVSVSLIRNGFTEPYPIAAGLFIRKAVTRERV